VTPWPWCNYLLLWVLLPDRVSAEESESAQAFSPCECGQGWVRREFPRLVGPEVHFVEYRQRLEAWYQCEACPGRRRRVCVVLSQPEVGHGLAGADAGV